MCPIEDSTTKSFPKKPAMVLALWGDSTMTRERCGDTVDPAGYPTEPGLASPGPGE